MFHVRNYNYLVVFFLFQFSYFVFAFAFEKTPFICMIITVDTGITTIENTRTSITDYIDSNFKIIRHIFTLYEAKAMHAPTNVLPHHSAPIRTML